MGFPFENDAPLKGCYAYGSGDCVGYAFWGTNGSPDQMTTMDLSGTAISPGATRIWDHTIAA